MDPDGCLQVQKEGGREGGREEGLRPIILRVHVIVLKCLPPSFIPSHIHLPPFVPSLPPPLPPSLPPSLQPHLRRPGYLLFPHLPGRRRVPFPLVLQGHEQTAPGARGASKEGGREGGRERRRCEKSAVLLFHPHSLFACVCLIPFFPPFLLPSLPL